MDTAYESIRVEVDGPVTTVVLARPERRNAVDGPMAAELADAFAAFDADPAASVAVLYGERGHFCAGADLTAVGTERGNTVTADGNGPMGPTRMELGKPVIAAVEGYAVAGGRSWQPGAICGWPPRMPCSGCSAGAGAFRWSTAARCGCPG